ncbi:MAG: O-antigen ligase family protein [Armatimonadota bacterium]
MFITHTCLLLAIFLVPLFGAQSGVLPLAVFAVLSAGGWIGWAVSRPARRPVPLRWPLAALFAATLAATAVSVYRPASVLGLWQLVVLLSLTILVFLLPLERRQLTAGLAAFSAGVLCGELYGFYSWFTWFLGTGKLDWRVQSTWENANFYAAFLLISLPVLVATLRLASQGWPRALQSVTVALGFLALVLTQSRGGLLVCFLLLLTLGPLWLKARGKLSAKALGLYAAGIALLIVLVLLSPVGKRVLDPEVRARQLHSQMFRVYTWQGTVRLIAGHPWLGTGPNTFPSIFGRYQIAGYTRHAHQIFLQTAAETGLVGLAALLWLFCAVLAIGVHILRHAGRNELPPAERGLRVNAAMALIAATLGLLLHGLLDANWLYPGIQLALLLQAALVWRLAMPDVAGKPLPAWVRLAVPTAILVIAVALLSGAGAEQTIEQARLTKDPTERARLFEEAVINAPTHAAYLRWASTAVTPDTGKEYLLRAIRMEPTNSANYLYLGNYELAQGNLPAAVDAYQRAEKEQPNLFPALYGLATTYWQQKQVALSRKAVQRILHSIGTPIDRYHPVDVPEPWYALAWYAEGDLARRAGELDSALKAYEMTLGATKKFEQGFQSEAQAVATVSGNTDQGHIQLIAILAHERLAELRPDTAEFHRKAIADAGEIPAAYRETPFP